jgi:glycosyltransferase involved in cell wall biosynthesis
MSPAEHPGPFLSAVIPVHNGAATLPALLDSLRIAEHPELEVIVVDDRSTDATPEICRAYPVRYVRLEQGRGPSAARNLGARLARGEVLLLLDDDVVIKSPDFISGVIARFRADPELTTLATISEKRPENPGFVPAYTALQEWVIYSRQIRGDQDQPWPEISTRCGAFRRELFLRIGGCDERFESASVEDADLLFRLLEAAPPGILCPRYRIGHHWPRRALPLLRNYVRRAALWIGVFRRYRRMDDVFATRREALGRLSDGLLATSAAAALLYPPLWGLSAAAGLLSAWCIRDFLAESHREYGPWFAVRAFLFHVPCSLSLLLGAALGAARLVRIPSEET